jgi:hypothetical protein
MPPPDDRYKRRTCANPIEHRPPPMVLEKHHVQPKSWGGPDIPENLVEVCSTCHMGAHTALNALVTYRRLGLAVPKDVWARFHPYYRFLAVDAVRRAGRVVDTFTLVRQDEGGQE